MLVLSLLAVFAIELADVQTKSKRDVEGRLHERSVLAAALIDSLFMSASQTALAPDVRLYGTPVVPGRLLQRNVGRNDYLALVNPSGNLVAASRGFTAQAHADLRLSETLRLLRAGHRWALGNVLPFGRHGVINYGIALPTAQGTRYLLTGLNPADLGTVLDRRSAPDSRGPGRPQLCPGRQRRRAGVHESGPGGGVRIPHSGRVDRVPSLRGYCQGPLLRPGTAAEYELAHSPGGSGGSPVRQRGGDPAFPAVADLRRLRPGLPARHGARPAGSARPRARS